MSYQIFIPDVRGASPQHLVEVGLPDFVAGAEFVDVAAGPAGAPGVVCAWRRPGQAQMGFQPDRQQWQPAAPREDLPFARYWVGFWNDAAIAPKALTRPYQQPGFSVRLGDEQDWLIPQARQLDADMVLADDGSWRFEVQRRFHTFYLEYLRWFGLMTQAEEGFEFSYADAADFVLHGLQINYRLVPEAVSRLRLFSKRTVADSLFCILGVRAGGTA